MGSNLTLGTGTGTGTGTGLFHLSKYGLRVEFGFIKDGKSTDGKISKIMVRVRDGVRVISQTRSTGTDPYPSTHFGV